MRIGNAEVLRIEEYHGLGFPPKAFLPDWDDRLVDKHLHWLVPDHYAPEEGRLLGSIHSWVIKLPHMTVLVDTCSGNHKHRPDSPFFSMMNSGYLHNLAAAGVDPDEVDFVFCTHLHIDHAGWNTRLLDGSWVPTFRNAKYVVSRTEFERLLEEKVPSADHLNLIADTIVPIIESGQWLLIDAPFQLCEELYIEASPGHTAAHCHVTLTSGNEKAVFSGDIIHHPIQVYIPSWNSAACEAPEKAVITRLAVLENLSETGTWLMPIHFARPFCCRVGELRDTGFVCEMG